MLVATSLNFLLKSSAVDCKLLGFCVIGGLGSNFSFFGPEISFRDSALDIIFTGFGSVFFFSGIFAPISKIDHDRVVVK